MRHEIRSEIHCGAECVIVQGPGSTAEDRGSPEASQARSSRGPRTGLCDSREPIWGDRQGTEPPQHSKAVPRDVTVPIGLGFFCQRIQLLGKTQTVAGSPGVPHWGRCVSAIQTGICLGFGEGWELCQLVAEMLGCVSLSCRVQVHLNEHQRGKI